MAGGKKGSGPNRASSATPREATSAGIPEHKKKIVVWPEWNDADVNGEKWDAAHKGKEDKKGKSPTVQQHQHLFEDPDGRLEVPASLQVDHWKRPHEFLVDKVPVVVDIENMCNDFDLVSGNEHLHESECGYCEHISPVKQQKWEEFWVELAFNQLVRYIISQVTVLWTLCANKNTTETPDPAVPGDDPVHGWRPWEHIYSLCKVVKHHIPLFNPQGKYIVRLYWMGCWRKIVVDDLMPFDEHDRLLLPVTALPHELWPMLLAKALIKVASLDYRGGNPGLEFGDMTIIHCLTGWLPETISLHVPCSITASQFLDRYYLLAMLQDSTKFDMNHRYGHLHDIWELLQASLPEWHLPEPESDKSKESVMASSKDRSSSGTADGHKEEKVDTAHSKDTKSDKQEKGKDGAKDKAKDKDKSMKEDKKDKKDREKEKEKEKGKEKIVQEEFVLPDKPEVVVLAMFGNMAKHPVKVSALGEMANASEHLRQNGLNYLYPHTVCVTQTRSCPLEPPPPPEVVPAWKLIRPRRKKTQPTDEPKNDIEVVQDIRCLEITSPFVNYKISPVPVPVETHRSKSSLERGGTRSRPTTASVMSIQEMDENVPESEELQNSSGSLNAQPQVYELPEDGGLAGSMATKQNAPGKYSAGSTPKQNQSTPETGEAAERKTTRSESGGKDKAKPGRKPDQTEDKKDIKDKGDRKAIGNTGTAPRAGGSPASLGVDLRQSLLKEQDGEELKSELQTPKDNNAQAEMSKSRKVWMDFSEFCICFRTLYIFHKPHTYLCSQRHSDLRQASPTTATVPAKADKKGSQPSVGQAAVHDSILMTAPDDKTQYFLFVDSLEPAEIIVSFSVIPRWFDQQQVVALDEKRGRVKDLEKEATQLSSSSPAEATGKDLAAPLAPSVPPPVTPGTLVAEPYSWKSLVTGQPILHIRTTGTRASALILPAGRHVLRFMMSSPLGYHVHMCSTVNFVFGDEETVMPHLTNESCRFRENALQVIMSLGTCIGSFTVAEQFSQAWKQLVSWHCPYLQDKLLSKQHHFQVFNEALYAMLRKALQDVLSPDVAFAWRSFTFDVTSPNILGLPRMGRPETSNSDNTSSDPTKNTASATARSSAKAIKKQAASEDDDWALAEDPMFQSYSHAVFLLAINSSEPEKTESVWATRYLEPTAEEHVAAVKVQKVWRGHLVRRVKRARIPGTEENSKACEHLQRSWTVIEASAEENGLFLFREMFRLDSDIMCHYPFYKDEWNKISYADYKGSYPDMSSVTWFIVFREIFFVKEEMLAVPKLYVSLPTCVLRVVDNDTGQELPRVFQKVAPYVYRCNKRGYTFVAEAHTSEQPVLSGSWRMRLIGSLTALPAPRAAEVNSNFFVKEFRDYYIPNSKDIILRQSIKVAGEQLVSLQMSTSKRDVYVRLSVLDNEQEVVSTVGKGHVVIPALVLQKDLVQPPADTQQQVMTEPKRSSSRSSVRGGAKAVAAGKSKGTEAAADGRQSVSSQHSEPGVSDELEKETKPHKYIIQAIVLRNSWPLSESSWAFVQVLKEQEKNELKVEYKERLPSPPKMDKTPPAGATGQKGKLKGGKVEKVGKDKAADSKGSRPPSQQFDATKPHWTLRVVIDSGATEEVEVRKDTERADEIRALKKAWEDAEPGRAAKAVQSRLKYLSTHTIKMPTNEVLPGEKDNTEAVGEVTEQEAAVPQTPMSLADTGATAVLESESVLTLEPPHPPAVREILQPLDLTPFVRKTLFKPHFLDEAESQRLMGERHKEISEYKKLRQQVEAWRAQDRAYRNILKIRQLEEAQQLQTKLDIAREAINIPREAFRQRHLEAERRRQEELAAQEAQKAELEAKPDKGGKGAKDKKSPSGKKK